VKEMLLSAFAPILLASPPSCPSTYGYLDLAGEITGCNGCNAAPNPGCCPVSSSYNSAITSRRCTCTYTAACADCCGGVCCSTGSVCCGDVCHATASGTCDGSRWVFFPPPPSTPPPSPPPSAPSPPLPPAPPALPPSPPSTPPSPPPPSLVPIYIAVGFGATVLCLCACGVAMLMHVRGEARRSREQADNVRVGLTDLAARNGYASEAVPPKPPPAATPVAMGVSVVGRPVAVSDQQI